LWGKARNRGTAVQQTQGRGRGGQQQRSCRESVQMP
jgi:hypothetical protein